MLRKKRLNKNTPILTREQMEDYHDWVDEPMMKPTAKQAILGVAISVVFLFLLALFTLRL